MPLHKWRHHLLAAGLSAFFACLQLRLILMLFGGGYARAANAAMDVLLGQPHWRSFQARILAPWLVEMLSLALPSFFDAYLAFSLLTLGVAGFLSWRLGWRFGRGAGPALLAFFIFQAGFAFLLSPPWLHAWDYLDVVLVLVFIDFVVARRPWPWFLVLLAIGIYSRETMVLIPVWMVLEGGIGWLRRSGRSAEERRASLVMAATGVVAVALSFVAIETVTHLVYVQEIGPGIFGDASGSGGVHGDLQLVENVELAYAALTQWGQLDFVVPIFLAVNLALAVALAWFRPRRYLALGLAFVLHEGATLAFGRFPETRLYVEMIPMIVATTLILSQTGDERTGDEQTGDEQTGDEQTGDEQTGDEQTGDEQTEAEDQGA